MPFFFPFFFGLCKEWYQHRGKLYRVAVVWVSCKERVGEGRKIGLSGFPVPRFFSRAGGWWKFGPLCRAAASLLSTGAAGCFAVLLLRFKSEKK